MTKKETDQLGQRMKGYEAAQCEARFDTSLPVYARIDGRAFSTFTRGMNKPFDSELILAMKTTTAYLVKHTHAKIGYVQSDEISLVWLNENENGSIFFDGRIQKMTSVLASLATAALMDSIPERWRARRPHFDCRVVQMPSKTEAANMFVWRALDARKNAISSCAQALFSHKQLHKKSQADMVAMLADVGFIFDDLRNDLKHGAYLRNVARLRTLTEYERLQIPEKHRPAPNQLVERHSVEPIDMPFLPLVVNREQVIFEGAQPQVDVVAIEEK